MKTRPEQLRKMAPHIVYEWDMLIATAAVLASSNATPGVVRNSIVEAFLLHARQLVDFFTESGMKSADNCYASDYCPAGWPKHEVGEGALKEARDAVNKYVGHVTMKRLTAREWNVGSMLEALRPIAAEFQATASPELFPELERLSTTAPPILVTGTTTTTGISELVLKVRPL